MQCAPSFPRLTLAAAIAICDFLVASNAQFRSFVWKKENFRESKTCLRKIQVTIINKIAIKRKKINIFSRF